MLGDLSGALQELEAASLVPDGQKPLATAKLEGVTSVNVDLGCSCEVTAVDVHPHAVALHVAVVGYDHHREECNAGKSKLLVVGKSSGKMFGQRCGVKGETLVASQGTLTAQLAFALPCSLESGDELLFEFGGAGFSVVSLGRV